MALLKIKQKLLILAFMAALISIVLYFSFIISHNNTDKHIRHRFASYTGIVLEFGLLYVTANSGSDPVNAIMPSLVHISPEGKELYSWRFSTMLAAWPLPMKYPVNKKWTSIDLETYREFSDSRFCYPKEVTTNVFAIGGIGSAFDRNNPIPARELPDNLILFADVYETNINWMEPGDYDVNQFPLKFDGSIRLGNKKYPGFIVVFVDGEIWHLKSETPMNLLSKFCTIDEAHENSRELLFPFKYSSDQIPKEIVFWRREI